MREETGARRFGAFPPRYLPVVCDGAAMNHISISMARAAMSSLSVKLYLDFENIGKPLYCVFMRRRTRYNIRPAFIL